MYTEGNICKQKSKFVLTCSRRKSAFFLKTIKKYLLILLISPKFLQIKNRNYQCPKI